MSGRQRERERVLRRGALVAGGLAVLALLFLVSGHWVLAIVAGVPAAIAVWVYVQARGVR